MFAALLKWLRSDETTTRRSIVRLEDIPTWMDLYRENKQEFVDTLSGTDESPQYSEDPEINRKVSIYGSDITSFKIDGIVRSTDTSLTSTDGISGAIKTAAGPKLDAELRTLRGCDPGEAKTTLGFNLPATYIVHTVGTEQEQPEILERCYRSCLEQMMLNNMKSLAFCCISTGINGYPNDKAVLVALRTVRIWLEEMKTENKLDEVDRIIFCLFSEEDVLLYSIWMQIFFPSTYEAESISTVTDTVASTPEEQAAASYSGPSSENSEDSRAPNSSQLGQKKQKELRPLPGFIELTTELDMITLVDDPNTKRAKMPCGHVIGTDSMTDYFRNILEQGKYKFICPTPNCNREWEYFLVRHVASLTDEEMCEFEKKLTSNYLQKKKGTQMCPSCQTWCMRDPGVGNRVRCEICTSNNGKKFYFCWICLNEWKKVKKRFRSSGSCGNSNCDGKGKQNEILATCPTKRINFSSHCPIIRRCPGCGLLTEHREKCGHMSCRTCHIQFCFVCLKVKKHGKWQCHFLSTCKVAPRQKD